MTGSPKFASIAANVVDERGHVASYVHRALTTRRVLHASTLEVPSARVP